MSDRTQRYIARATDKMNTNSENIEGNLEMEGGVVDSFGVGTGSTGVRWDVW